jgi:hypothetical protein
LNTFFCSTFCIEIYTELLCGTVRTEWMPPLVLNENCPQNCHVYRRLLHANAVKNHKNGRLKIILTYKTLEVNKYQVNKEQVFILSQILLFSLTFRWNIFLLCCIALSKLLLRRTLKHSQEKCYYYTLYM